MRRSLLLALLLATSPVPAAPLGESLYPGLVEFEEAFEFYAAGDFERARTGFRHLAELGDPEAQLNLGVMLAKGEGGPVDRIEGAAWVRLAEAGGLEQARTIRELLENGLEQDQLESISDRLASLQYEGGAPNSDTPEPADPTASSIDTCPITLVERAEPYYPTNALWKNEMGLVELLLLVDPDGVVGASHTLYRPSTDEFGLAAKRATNRFRAGACPDSGHRLAEQIIEFVLGERNSETPWYSRGNREYAAELLTGARNGDAASALGVAMLAPYYDGLFDVRPGEVGALALAAAVAGVPEARYLVSGRDDRWLLLAARQGYSPALDRVAKWRQLKVAERKEALVVAARAGYEPAVFNAVRWLAAHPDPAERDGELALQLTEGFWRGQLESDLLLAQARAMALAETGQLRDAARLQKRTLRTLRKADHGTRLAEERLQAYEAGQAWRDQTLVEDLGLASKD